MANPPSPLPPQSAPRRAWIVGIVTIFCLAYLCAQLSYRLRQENIPEVLAGEAALLEGRPGLPEFQNRILSPYLRKLAILASGGALDDLQAWKLVRLFSACLAFGVCFGCVARLTGSPVRGTLACLGLAYGYLWTIMTHQWEHSTDFFDLMFMTLFVYYAVRGNVWGVAIFAVLAAFNRESAAFGGIVLIGQALTRRELPTLRTVAWGVFCTALAAVVVEAIRYALSGHHTERQMLGIQIMARRWPELLLPYGSGVSAVAMFAPIVLALWNQPSPFSPTQRGLLLACLPIAAISCVFGIIVELRVLLPTYLLLVMTVALGGERNGLWLGALLGDREPQGPAVV